MRLQLKTKGQSIERGKIFPELRWHSSLLEPIKDLNGRHIMRVCFPRCLQIYIDCWFPLLIKSIVQEFRPKKVLLPCVFLLIYRSLATTPGSSSDYFIPASSCPRAESPLNYNTDSFAGIRWHKKSIYLPWAKFYHSETFVGLSFLPCLSCKEVPKCQLVVFLLFLK